MYSSNKHRYVWFLFRCWKWHSVWSSMVTFHHSWLQLGEGHGLQATHHLTIWADPWKASWPYACIWTPVPCLDTIDACHMELWSPLSKSSILVAIARVWHIGSSKTEHLKLFNTLYRIILWFSVKVVTNICYEPQLKYEICAFKHWTKFEHNFHLVTPRNPAACKKSPHIFIPVNAILEILVHMEKDDIIMYMYAH